ncbi:MULTISPECIES: hypothetical protein [Burkholderia]|uniref:hypothetical protein n=1 Tax=Burkholderia TaxID=32008 RepID=UPI0009E07D26|nr:MULTISPECIES: hypothetical protein [Burkholderia]
MSVSKTGESRAAPARERVRSSTIASVPDAELIPIKRRAPARARRHVDADADADVDVDVRQNARRSRVRR